MGLVISRQLIRNEEWNRWEDESVARFQEDDRLQSEFEWMRSIYPFYQPQQLVELQRAIRRWLAMKGLKLRIRVRETINQFKNIRHWNLDA